MDCNIDPVIDRDSPALDRDSFNQPSENQPFKDVLSDSKSTNCTSFSNFSKAQLEQFKNTWCNQIRHEIDRLRKKQQKALRNLKNSLTGKPLDP